jgi:hypothetical protein
MSKAFKLTDYAQDFYGNKNYTIEEGVLNHKGIIEKENNLSTNFKNVYYYREGLIAMRLDGRQAQKFVNEFNKILGL